jgi:copper oxidase (laccase) domain-containing protein
VGLCCYEVDAPVLVALRARFSSELEAAQVPTREGHARVDLGALALLDLQRMLPPARAARIEGACTRCDAARFHSYRRDGPRSGRLLHWVQSPSGDPLEG